VSRSSRDILPQAGGFRSRGRRAHQRCSRPTGRLWRPHGRRTQGARSADTSLNAVDRTQPRL